MNSMTRQLALGLFSLGFSTLAACGGPVEDVDTAEAPVGQATSALTSCNAPIQGHARWLAGDDPGAFTNFVSAHVQAPGINRTMWIDQHSVQFTPPFCLPGGACFPGLTRYTIRGTYAGDTISVDSDGYMTINGTRVTPTSCTVPSGPSSSRVVGRDAAGNVFTVTLYNQYLG